MDNMVDNDKNTKCIKVFDNIFFIESEPNMNGERQRGWKVKVTFRSEEKEQKDIVEKYTDYVDSRTAAEEACFGYMLIEHCGGGIYWKECNFPNSPDT
jgi:hypothetical protein